MTKLATAIETVSAFLAAELEMRKDSGLKAYIAEARRAVKAFDAIAKSAKKHRWPETVLRVRCRRSGRGTSRMVSMARVDLAHHGEQILRRFRRKPCRAGGFSSIMSSSLTLRFGGSGSFHHFHIRLVLAGSFSYAVFSAGVCQGRVQGPMPVRSSGIVMSW